MICGKEDLCDLLRDLTSIELYENQDFYAFHPYVKEKSHIFKSENTAFSATSSDSALDDGYDRKNPSSRVAVVKREAIQNATNGTFSSFMCLFALSSVTGMNVISVYPEKLGQETKYSQFQNGTISPRKSHDNFLKNLGQEVKLVFMWTTHGNLTLPGLNENFQPNHFVPLVEFTAKQGSKLKTIQQRKITELLKPEGANKDNVAQEGKYVYTYKSIFKLDSKANTA